MGNPTTVNISDQFADIMFRTTGTNCAESFPSSPRRHRHHRNPDAWGQERFDAKRHAVGNQNTKSQLHAERGFNLELLGVCRVAVLSSNNLSGAVG